MKRIGYALLVILLTAFLLESCCTEKCVCDPFASIGIQMHKLPGESDYIDPIGAQAGIGFHPYDFNENISFRPEVIISMQGAKYSDMYVDGRVNLLYANFPLLARYHHQSGVFGEIGLQPGLLLSAKDKYSDETHDYRDQLKPLDLGIPLGVGYTVNKNLGVGLRLIQGVSNINKSDTRVHNFVLALRATYSLHSLNKKTGSK